MGLWRVRDHVPGLLIVAVGLLLTLLAALVARARAVEAQQESLDRRAASVTQALNVSLDVWVEVLQQLTTFFESSTEVTRNDFRDFSAPVLGRHPEIGGLGWCPLVPHAQRYAIELQAQQSGPVGYQVRALAPDRSLIRAGEQPEYLPVLYLEPPNEMALGLDLYFSHERRAPADLARDTGRLIASARRNMVQDPPNVYTVLLHSPVYRRNAPLSTLEERRAAFLGVTIELLRIDEIINHALSDADLTGLDVELLDLSAEGPDRILWRSDGHQSSNTAQRWSKEFEFGERRWSLEFASEPISLASAAVPWWPMLAALGGSVILAGVVSARRMASRFEREVERAKTIGAYKLLGKIRGGGMGDVYRARHVLLRRPTAVKILKGAHRESELRRFEREVRLTASLVHPNTIVVFDYGRTDDKLFYYAMEFIDGLNLEMLVRQYGPLPPGRVIRIMRQVCAALAEAHGVGLIHRDIKPSNIMLCDRGGIPDMVKVLDFGLVKKVSTRDTFSKTGKSYGTPAYLAPESITHPEEITQQVDIYALGLVMHFLLTGVQPVRGETIAAIFYQVVTMPIERPSHLTDQSIPSKLEELIMWCVEKEPARRPSSAAELEQHLLELDPDDWHESDAREWWAGWREKRQSPRRAQPESAPPEQTELTVDLEGRQPTVPEG